MIEYITQIILAIWLIIATITLILMNRILKNHEALLYHLRDEIVINRYKDRELTAKFNSKGITLNDMEEKQ